MSNKTYLQKAYIARRKQGTASPFSLHLTNSQELKVTPLNYSVTSRTSQELTSSSNPPLTAEFSFQEPSHPRLCARKDCLDRKFQAIKKLQDSSQARVVSPSRVDIVLQQSSMILPNKVSHLCIHSSKYQPKRHSVSRDQLKDFREIEGMRQALKSRNYHNSHKVKIMVHASRQTQSAQENPEQRTSGSGGGISANEVRVRTARMHSQKQKKLRDMSQDEKVMSNALLK